MTTATRSSPVVVHLTVAVLIEILVTKNCPREDAALRLVAMAAQMTGVAPQVMLVEVTDLAEARRTAFPGSPTIRVNGRDVAPAAMPDAASLRCRDYPTDHGRSDIPRLSQLLEAIAITPPAP
ncbi:MAG: thioredoxin family protein [Solirubrobacteraceae bacterium]